MSPAIDQTRDFPPENCLNTIIFVIKWGARRLGSRKVILNQSGLMHNYSKINAVHNLSPETGFGGRGWGGSVDF